MYPVSAAYKTAIRQNTRDVCISGTITLKDTTVINISDEDIVQGSLYFTEQCVSGEDIEIGNVYASEMGLSLSSPPENPYSLDGARIIINFGIDIGGSYEYVPLGYFYVTEIERKATVVNLKALDGMILFDVDISGVQTSGTPYEIVSSCCAKAGITLATDLTTFNTFANAGTTFVLPEENSVKTCRDLLMWVCQLTGTFARMNRLGQLEIIPITGRAPVKTISKDERFVSDVSDFYVQISKVSMKVGETEYSQGTDGMTMSLEENPFLVGLDATEINAALSNILNQVTLAEYTPSNVDFPGDPSLQAGDYVTLTDAGILDSEVETGTYFLSPAFPASIEVRRNIATSMITHHTWRYRGKHNLKSAGKSDLIQVTQSQQSKAVSTIVAVARAAQEIAKAANQSTQLINDAIGGHVLIRQNPDETNEILIMDSADPDQAVKIWRWNMGGLGYSDNCTGADNPARQYEVAMTMDGAINANFIKTGKIAAQYITVGPETVFADGYDPTAIQIGGRNLIIRHNEVPNTMIGEDGVSAPLVGSSMVNGFIPVQPGDTLTFSQIIQSGTGDDYFRCAFYTDPLDNASYVVRRISNNATVFTETVPEGAYWLRVSYAAKNKVQLERGTRSTDWTPAPEDVEDYADYKAQEAQTAAEAVARAEADLAETQAKAYADGAVSAEEQARIDDANAKLAEAKSYAETKSGEAQTAAQAYAEQKAQEAQSAAEAVARAEATLAQVNAEAYADGKVSAEEQARIDQAAANLAEAKTHAEAKAAEAESAAKTHTDAQISDHDANQSPHSLPAYVRMEPTGFVVYDEQGVKRTHNGMYAPGEYGNWVDAGYYVLRDKGMDMSLMQLPNMVLDHSFEMLKEEGPIDVTYYDYAILNGSGGWGKIGEPRMYSYVSGDGYLSWQSDSFFGVRSVVVNSTNYLQTGFYCKPNTQYFISGFVCLGYRNPTAGTPRIVVEFWESNEEKWPPEDPIHISTTGQNFTPNTDKKFNWKRVGFAFTTPSNCDQMRIQVKSADANYVCWDAIQVVEANKPVRYDPERTLFWHIDENSLQMGLGGHIIESGVNSNGRYVKFSDGTQICWFQAILNFTISSPYGSLYLGSVNVWYPKTFVGIPNVCVGSCRHGTGASWGTAYDIKSTYFMMRVIDIAARTDQNLDYGYVAIGRWK
jgi:flagellar biosynthesis GTPase FlhF